MRALIFDTGPIISLTTTNLLWVLKELKEKFNGEFFITEKVKKELIDNPINIKRFKFEALQVLNCIEEDTLKILKQKTFSNETNDLLNLVNHCFKAKGNWIQLCHYGEMEVLAAAIATDAEGVVMDERTTRMMIEDPLGLKRLMENKLATRIEIDGKNIARFKELTKNIRIIRSAELGIIAYESGLLDTFIGKIPNPRKELLQGILWGIKLHGCAVTRSEIDGIVAMELGKTR